MKYLFPIIISCLSLSAFAQGSFATYLETSEPANLKELADKASDPMHAAEFKSNPMLVKDFVDKAGSNWREFSQLDITSWKEAMKYLIGLGIPVNGKNEEDVYNSLFYLTAPFNLGELDTLSNRYLLHTSLIDLGGKTEVRFDGISYLQFVLREESAASALRQIYLSDFKSWDVDRKRNFLFTLLEEDADTDEEVSKLLESLLKAAAVDVNLRTKNEKVSLFDAAIRTGKFQTADLLLENGFNINQRCFACEGQTSLHNVVKNKNYVQDERNYDLIVKMMDKGGDADLRDMKAFTPIHHAIMLKAEPAFKAFMSDSTTFNFQIGTMKGKSYFTFFEDEWGDEDYLEMLVKKTELKAPLTKKEIKKEANKKKEALKAKQIATKAKEKAAKEKAAADKEEN